MDWEEYQKNCYYLSRYQNQLRTDNRFDIEATRLIEAGLLFGKEKGIAFLEEMIVKGSAYDEMDRKYCPILIYVGDTVCYGVLDRFARLFGNALEKCGYKVEYFDPMGDRVVDLIQLDGLRFRAVIGIQTFAFSVKMKNGENFHDRVIGPKFNFFLDHPVWLRQHLECGPKEYYILTQDEDYVKFIGEYFPKIRRAYFFSPAGEVLDGGNLNDARDYDISFIGTYHDWRKWKETARAINRKTFGIARVYMKYMLANRGNTWEGGLQKVLEAIVEEKCLKKSESYLALQYRLASDALVEKGRFLDLLYDMQSISYIVRSYLREKILDVIAASDLRMHVFGESFQVGRYANQENFICHASCTPQESLSVYAHSKISLNIMSWHKAGMTERIANMMLNGAVVVSDDSRYLKENYDEGKEYIAFSLNEIDELPKLLKGILADEERQEHLRQNAFCKASQKETWDVCARKFISLLSNVEAEMGE